MQEYKNQLEELSSTVAMIQQHVTSLKQENLILQEKARKDCQDLENYCEENEQYGRRFCLRIKNMKQEEDEPYKKVLEVVKCLFSEASINITDACIDYADRVSRTNDTVIVCFTPHCFVTALCFTGKGRHFKME